MAGLADWLEDYRNWRGRQEWEQGKGWQDFFGGDPRAQEQFEKLSGFGTDAGGLVGMIKASHGSPHAFTKFDFSKIGTGEGAQAYGHGGYFAQGFDSPVAKEYRDALAGVEVGGKVMTPEWDSPYYYPLQALRKHGDDIEKARADVYERNKNIPGGWPEELVAFEDAVKQGIKRNQGHLYNVELKWPDAAREAADPLGEHHLLDWDAPLSEQPSIVREALSGLNLPLGTYGENPVGAHAYAEMSKRLDQGDQELLQSVKQHPNLFAESPELVSAWLKSKGIPGIRYLDQASRGAGQGTRNYVMFDDALANIVSRNGVSLSDLLQNQQQLKSIDTSYQTGHTAPGPDFGAQLHDLTGGGTMYPDDIYSANAARFYGHGGQETARMDKKAVSLIHMLRNKPDELVDIYRAVPKDENITTINPGDWVTITPDYAKYHGEGPLGGDYKILKQKVPAKSIWTNADSIHEYGYWPDQ